MYSHFNSCQSCQYVQNLHKLAEELVGKVVYSGWPYLTEVKVHSISDGVVKYSQVGDIYNRERDMWN